MCGSVSKKEIRKISEILCRNEMNVKRGSFEKAMCTSGGVNLKEVSSKTMESKIVEGLYFCGEILDIDGNTVDTTFRLPFQQLFPLLLQFAINTD